MNNSLQKTKKTLEMQRSELIQAHILDPEHSPLPENLREQCNRILQVAKLLDSYPNESNIINIMLAKYRVSRTQIRRDIALAKELFKTQHEFDWDFWFAWMIKDQVELIKQCQINGDFKNWNNAKKVLCQMIGEKPAGVEDPKRMEKNVFYIQINNGTDEPKNIPLEEVRELNSSDQKKLIDSLFKPVDDIEAEEIMNS